VLLGGKWLISWEKETKYLQNSSPVGPQTQCGFFGEKNSLLSEQEIEPQKVKFIIHPSPSMTTIIIIIKIMIMTSSSMIINKEHAR